MPGPLPNPQARRRNAPTIPTTELPAGGRKGRPPKCPYELGKPGRDWWKWAWTLPQATRWDKGALYVVARRAQLEDELAALGAADSIDLADLIGMDRSDLDEQLRWLFRSLKSHASGTTTVMREMRELDNRLGLNPKALADLRWSIAEKEDAPPATAGRAPGRGAARRTGTGARLRAV